MGLLNSENEDVTNVTSESSNPYTSLKFQLIRWKRSSSWTWTMSPPSTSSDTTCYQHCSLLPLPRWSMLIQCILQYYQICNLEAEQVKMNVLLNGREDHPLIPSMPWYLTRILYFKPKYHRMLQDTSTSPSWNPVHPRFFLWDPQKYSIPTPMQRLESVNQWLWWFLRFDCYDVLLSSQANCQ